MFKKFLIVSALLSSMSATAANIEVVTTSTLRGPQGTVINLIADESKVSGFNITARQTGGCGEAVSYFENATGPVGIIWSDTMIANSEKTRQNCVIDFTKARAVLVTYAPYDICMRKDFKLEKGASLLLGNNKFNPQESHLEHLNQNNLGIKFKNITFDGSGPVLAALINKEIDVGYIASSNATSAIQAGSITCQYSTGSTRFGQRPLSEFAGINRLSQFKLGMLFFVKNVSDGDLAKLQTSLSKISPKFEVQDLVQTTVVTDIKIVNQFIDGAKFNATLK
jgi:hypothetical protein